MVRVALRCLPSLLVSLLGVGLAAQQATPAVANTHRTIVVRQSASPLRHTGAPTIRHHVVATVVESASAGVTRRAAPAEHHRLAPLRR